MTIFRLEEDRKQYKIKGENYLRVKYYQNVLIKSYANRLEPNLKAIIDTGASISILMLKESSEIEKTIIDNEDVPKELKELYGITERAQGTFAIIEVKFPEQADYLPILVFMVDPQRVEDERQKLILGSLGFLEKRNLILLPTLEKSSVIYQEGSLS